MGLLVGRERKQTNKETKKGIKEDRKKGRKPEGSGQPI